MEDAESVVKTSLKMKLPVIRQVLEDIVQLRSRVESFGTAVFTQMLLLRFENSKPITEHFVSRGCITACLRSVCVRRNELIPSEADFKHPEVRDCIRKSGSTSRHRRHDEIRHVGCTLKNRIVDQIFFR